MNTTNRAAGGAVRGMVGLVLIGTVAIAGCDFLDPTDVENPRTTVEDLANAENPTASLLAGGRAQFARLVSSASVVSEVVSDNYSIHGTGLSKVWDTPRDVTSSIANSTGDDTGLYWNAQELKALTSFILDEIAPNDDTALPDDIAEAHYYRGMAYLMLGENFSFAPVEPDAAPLSAAELLDRAVAEFGEAASFGTRTTAALARVHRARGDATAASTAAGAALAADAEFAFLQEFDVSSVENTPHAYLVTRALQEMQPLPRLDFLDPKFLTRESGIAVAKAEEMHLILAEAALAAADLPTAQTELRNAILLAQSRGTDDFDDDDPRLNANLSVRPRDATITVRADAASPYRAGLVLTRPGVVTQAPLSGTSLDGDSVAALATEDELWHAFHLARQEILFLEGRRMSDLGIRLPMMSREIDANPAITSGDPGTAPVVPAYIPAGDGMDIFSPATPYEIVGESVNLIETQVTINVDMNRVLADNRVTPFGS
jgi:hypothetical protein